MKFCPVVPEICRGQVHGARKERRITRTRIIIIIRNGAKTISLQTLFGRLNNCMGSFISFKFFVHYQRKIYTTAWGHINLYPSHLITCVDQTHNSYGHDQPMNKMLIK